MDEKRRQNLLLRAKIIQGIRQFFIDQGFVEIETPYLVSSPGMEPHLSALEVFCARPTGEKFKRYLHTSPEYAMKKLLGEGWDKIFQICRVFRDEEISALHQIEFTMLEWYRTKADYFQIMDDCENLIEYLSQKILGRHNFSYQGARLDFTPPFPRLRVAEAMRFYGQVDIEKNRDQESLLQEALRQGYSFDPQEEYSYDDIFFKIFLDKVEPNLGFPKPTILYDYPAHMAALARLKPDNPLWAERFELYMAGLELANAFSELVDPEEQRQRFVEEQKLRARMGKPVYPIDEELLQALAYLPPAAGIALGIDRLLMVFCDSPKIQDVLAFALY
ncbi:MAG: EF-P lysine aminoacylase EpmA [Thermodesulfobacteriota bacterium]